SIPARLALLDARRRRLAFRFRGLDLRRDDARSLRVELDQEVLTLIAHRGEIARDAAVVANELPILVRVLFEVLRVDERAGDFPARRREAALHRLAILRDQKAFFEPHVDVAPRKTRAHRDRPQKALWIDAVLRERLLPQIELQVLVPRIEARAAAVRRLEHVA